MTGEPAANDLTALIDRWMNSGIITGEQAERMRADVPAGPIGGLPGPAAAPAQPPNRGQSLIIEAMGYLGGVIVLVGLGLAVSFYWEELSETGRLALAGGAALLLGAAGAALPQRLDAVGRRLHAVLWMMASVALFTTLSLLADESYDWYGNDLLLFSGGITAGVSAGLWFLHRHALQQATTLVFLLLAAGAATAMAWDYDFAPLTTVWLIGLAWIALAWFGLLPPRRVGLILGAATTIVGAIGIHDEDWGSVAAVATVAGLVALAVAIRDLFLLAVASIGTLIVLTAVVVKYFPGVIAAALTLVVVGLILVAVAVFTARRRRPTTAQPITAQPTTGQPAA